MLKNIVILLKFKKFNANKDNNKILIHLLMIY